MSNYFLTVIPYRRIRDNFLMRYYKVTLELFLKLNLQVYVHCSLKIGDDKNKISQNLKRKLQNFGNERIHCSVVSSYRKSELSYG